MQDAFGPLLILGIGGVVLFSLSIGAVVGWRWRGTGGIPAKLFSPRSTLPAAPAGDLRSGLPPAQIAKLLVQIKRLAGQVSAEACVHSSRIENVNQEIGSQSADDPSDNACLGTVRQFLRANEQLLAELDAAGAQLLNHVQGTRAQGIQAHAAPARTDAPCEAANLRAFDEELGRRIAELETQGKSFSLILLDVDHFKRFNDRHGRQAGDEVLRAAGRVLSAAARQCDLVTRYGGEGFAVIVPECSFAEAQEFAERLRLALASHPIEHEGETLQATFSLGVAEARPGGDPGTVVAHADQAMYAAKLNGRNCTYFFNGHSCERFDAGWIASNRDMWAALQPQQLDGAERTGTPLDRRSQPRRPFPANQFIAPYLEGKLPTKEMFQQVRCHEISSGGVSFFLPQPPEFDSLIVALGTPPKMTCLASRIVHTCASNADGGSMYLVGCRFLGRVELNVECIAAPLTAAAP